MDDWRVYLRIQEDQAREARFEVQYSGIAYSQNKEKVTLSITLSNTTPEERKRLQRLKEGETIFCSDKSFKSDLGEEDSFNDLMNSSHYVEGDYTYGTKRRGKLAKYEAAASTLHIDVDERSYHNVFSTEGQLKLGKVGFIASLEIGTLNQVKNQREALQKLVTNACNNPRLGKFLFDGAQAELPQEAVTLQSSDVLNPSLLDNLAQKWAVEGALAAPDLFLIWGHLAPEKRP